MNRDKTHSGGWRAHCQRLALASLAVVLAGTALAQAPRPSTTVGPKPPIVLESTGAFEVGGKVIRNPDNPTQTLSCDHGYVEYFIPQNRRQVGLILWHSSSTKVWENRWDGGEGYKSLFLRQRYPVYLWDGPRVGPSFMNWHPGVQFPTGDAEAWNQATRARYDEFDTLDNALLQGEAGGQAIDKLGPVVAVTNSAGGWRALLSALNAKAGNMKGLVAYETPGFVFPEGEGVPPAPKAPFGPNAVPLAEFMKLTKFPMQMVFGDHTATHPTWSIHLKNARTFCEVVNQHGGDCEVLLLSDAGLHGNTHIPFADLNNEAVAAELSKWLRRKGLDK
jgi:hypothetical protein